MIGGLVYITYYGQSIQLLVAFYFLANKLSFVDYLNTEVLELCIFRNHIFCELANLMVCFLWIYQYKSICCDWWMYYRFDKSSLQHKRVQLVSQLESMRDIPNNNTHLYVVSSKTLFITKQ